MKRKRIYAFTLLEIIVAVAVLGVGLVVILHSFSVAARGVRFARSVTQATHLAQAKMAELETVPEIETAETSGDFEPDFPGYSWEAQISPVVSEEEGEEKEELFTIQLSVFWGGGENRRRVELSTLRFTTGGH